MFYFGGITLGYLDRPQRTSILTDAAKTAKSWQQAESETRSEKVPASGELLARANWFNLFW